MFSDLNNLTDITMDARNATMLGYTQSEFEFNFREQIAKDQKKQNLFPNLEVERSFNEQLLEYCCPCTAPVIPR